MEATGREGTLLHLRPGAATPGVSPENQDSSSSVEKKEVAAIAGDGTVGLAGISEWLAPKLDGFLMHRLTKPTGRLYPLPSSNECLAALFSSSSPVLVRCLRNLVLGLNSLNGEGLDSHAAVNTLQRRVLSFLHEQCLCFLSREASDDLPEWEDFFKVRGIDYRGEEVLTAQSIEWENISPALPQEVGSVDLSQVVERGCLHYVNCFEEYLLPEEDQVYVRPPKVMVPEHGWTKVCQGLLQLGVCRLIPESAVHRVQGRLLLNGLFGVSKREFQGPWEVRRLIMNLTPCNAICKSMDGDVATLPSWSNMHALQLHPDEDLVVSSEDVRCFFYIFKVPPQWFPFLAFNRLAPRCVCPDDGRYYLCSAVLPMGFKNSVSLAQHVHRVIVKRALAASNLPIGGESEIRKDEPFPGTTSMFRIYLDNFDQLSRVNKGLADVLQGKASQLALGLREEYLRLNVPRHPKKSVEQQRTAEVQGAIIDGSLGVAYPKPDKILKYCHFGRKLLEQSHCTQRQAQVVGGGFVYMCMFRRPLLGSLNHIWKFITKCEGLPPVVRHLIPPEMKAEIARFISLCPLAFVDFRVSPSPVVTASDASEFGGGVTMSTGLTESGVIAAGCNIRGDVLEPLDAPTVLAVGLFDGIAALRVAMDVLGWNVQGHISVESDECARRVVEAHFPSSMFVHDVREITLETVKNWAGQFSQVSLVALGAGPPCQGVSPLNAGRKGALRDERTSLFCHVPRIKDLLVQAFPWARVVQLMENVSGMDKEDLATMSSTLELQPYLVDGKDFTLARRPRFFWLDWELLPQQGVQIVPAATQLWTDHHEVHLSVPCKAERYLQPGWKKPNGEPFPTFTTSRCREHPGRRPAGLHQCEAHEIQRWQADWHRYPPYQYRDVHMVKNRQGALRPPSVEERECILGFPRAYTHSCMKKPLQGTEAHLEKRLTLLGNTWCVPVIAWLLNHLGHVLGFHELYTPAQIVERCAPGSTTSLQSFLLRPSMKQSKPSSCKEEQQLELVNKLSSLVSLKGEDLLLQTASEDTVHMWCGRTSTPSKTLRTPPAGVPGKESGPMPKRVLEAQSQEDRVKQRQALGTLRQLTVQPTTRRRYDAALAKFFDFLKEHHLVLPNNIAYMDNLACDYMEHLWASGAGRALAADSLASLQDHQPQLKGRLTGAWRLLRAWNQTEIPSRAPPMPLEVLDAMVGLALFRKEPLFGLSLLVGFHGLLRTGEILNITKSRVSVTSHARSVLFALGLTKGGKRHGASESVKLTVYEVNRRVQQWIEDPRSTQSLTPPAHVWRKKFADYLEALGFTSLQFRPYSLRRGGATFLFRQQGVLDRLMVHGRWQSQRSCRIYIDEGMALLASLHVPWTPFARQLRTQFLNSSQHELPKLEPMTPVRAGAGGRKRQMKDKKSRKKEKG
eukprot:Skav223681  [mRNA]  locus=scaffold3470:134573:139091:+ [translate_table: standard]